MAGAMMILAWACVLPGIAPGLFLRPLNTLVQELAPGAALPQEAWSLAGILPWLAIGLAALVAAGVAIRRLTRVTPTWACGMPSLDSRMQYSSTAFAKPLRKAFSQVYKADRTLEFLPVDRPLFPAAISYRSARTTSFEKSLYRPAVDAVVRAAHRLRRLQTGNIQVYLLYIFGALILLLIFTRWA
jgi:NADH:ubiquinone oxidoreductase subunit 5 (subunit L)/multisubunit Na+/H+ antiporter MnhA subunit